MPTTAIQPLAGAYTADPVHSSFAFAVRYMGVSTFRGTLGDVAATLHAGPDGVSLEGADAVDWVRDLKAPEWREPFLAAGW